MAKLKGKNFKYLGHFRNPKVIKAGHNTSHPKGKCEKCMAKCAAITSPLRKRTCETNCAINAC